MHKPTKLRLAAALLDLATEKVVKQIKRDYNAETDAMQNGQASPATLTTPPARRTSKRNVLARVQVRKVEDWLSSQWTRVETDKPTMETVAVEATAALGFPVSPGNVFGATRTIGKVWPAPINAAHAGLGGNKSRRTGIIVRQIAAILAAYEVPATEEFKALAAEMESPSA